METWYFTFGMSSNLRGKYVKLQGSLNDTRIKMIRLFGSDWSTQYNEFEGIAVIKKWELEEHKI